MPLVKAWIIPAVACVLTLAVTLAARALVLRYLRRLADTQASMLARTSERILRGPSFFWCFALAVHAGVSTSTLPERYAAPLQIFVQLLILFSATLAFSNLFVAALEHGLTVAGSPVTDSGFLRGVVRIVVFTLGGLLALARLGIQIGPFLTALGVGGLALGLALQDTLGNLFAGLGLLLDRALQVGDYVTLQIEGGYQGRIEDIGWRSTKVRTAGGDLLVIPNTKLAQNVAMRKAEAPKL